MKSYILVSIRCSTFLELEMEQNDKYETEVCALYT